MNGRQRLLAALDRKKHDRVPISTYELCGYNSKSFENNQPSYNNLMDNIRKKTDAITMWNPSDNTTFALSAYPVEVESVKQREDNYVVEKNTIITPKGKLHSINKVMDNINTVWNTEHWCKSVSDVDAYMSIPYVKPKYDFSNLARIKQELGDNGIIMASLSDPACTAMEIMEFGEATVWAMTEEDHFRKTMNELHKRTMVNLECMLEAGVVDLYRICGPEYITPPYLPPIYFEKYVYPYIKDMTTLIHKYNSRVRIHSHGRIGKVLEMIIASGADAIDPCEAPPDGDISLEEVSKIIDGKMTVFGNLQLKLLEHGTKDEVKREVEKCMNAAKWTKRYVIMPTASPINVPLSLKTEENYNVFIDTALELGCY